MADTLKQAAEKRRTAKGLTEKEAKRLSIHESQNSSSEAQPQTVAPAPTRNLSYRDLNQVEHGLSLPRFDPNSYIAGDLFTDSSALQRTTKVAADAQCESVEEKRQTVRVTRANLALNSDIIDAGIDQRKLDGKVISWANEHVKNEQKYINLQTEYVNRDIALSRYAQTAERLTHSNIALAGLQSQTQFITQEWEERINLSISKVRDVRIAALKAEDRIKTERASLPPQAQDLVD